VGGYGGALLQLRGFIAGTLEKADVSIQHFCEPGDVLIRLREGCATNFVELGAGDLR
jgi:hypothetical protein